jgi:hypothetical protein
MRIKTLVVLFALPALAAGCNRDATHAGGSGSSGSDAAATGAAPGGSAAGGGTSAGTSGGGMPFPAEVVSVENGGRSLILRESSGSGPQRSLPVDPAAATSVASLRPGDPVLVTCDSAAGTGSGSMSSGPGATGSAASGPGDSNAAVPGATGSGTGASAGAGAAAGTGAASGANTSGSAGYGSTPGGLGRSGGTLQSCTTVIEATRNTSR